MPPSGSLIGCGRNSKNATFKRGGMSCVSLPAGRKRAMQSHFFANAANTTFHSMPQLHNERALFSTPYTGTVGSCMHAVR